MVRIGTTTGESRLVERRRRLTQPEATLYGPVTFKAPAAMQADDLNNEARLGDRAAAKISGAIRGERIAVSEEDR